MRLLEVEMEKAQQNEDGSMDDHDRCGDRGPGTDNLFRGSWCQGSNLTFDAHTTVLGRKAFH